MIIYKITCIKCLEHCLVCKVGCVHVTYYYNYYNYYSSSYSSLNDLQSVFLTLYRTKPFWEKTPMGNLSLSSMTISQSIIITLDLHVWSTSSPWTPFSRPQAEYYSRSIFKHSGSLSSFSSLKVVSARAQPSLGSASSSALPSSLFSTLSTLSRLHRAQIPRTLSPVRILLILDHLIFYYHLKLTKPKSTFTVFLLNPTSWPSWAIPLTSILPFLPLHLTSTSMEKLNEIISHLKKMNLPCSIQHKDTQ